MTKPTKERTTDMQTMTTQTGITLETLRRRERDAAAAVALACAAALALIGAGCVLAACLRGCAADPAPAGAAACYEANWSRGLYADELAGSVGESNGIYWVGRPYLDGVGRLAETTNER